MVVMFVPVIVMMMCACGERQKDTGHLFKRDMLAGEKLQDGWIFRYAHGVRQRLHAEVKIAQTPGHSSRLLQCGHRDLKNLFRGLFEDILIFAFGKEVGAMAQRLVEIETKFPSILRHAAPAPLGQRGSIRAQAHVMMMAVMAVAVGQFLDES